MLGKNSANVKSMVESPSILEIAEFIIPAGSVFKLKPLSCSTEEKSFPHRRGEAV